jgi:threonine aldolase
MAFPDGTADFRSDTVTRPTPEMRRAMAEAEVGDDVYGEDPTVRALEEEAAAAVGKEAALFVPSGVMGNQIAVNLQTRPGDEVLCSEWAHVRNFERGAAPMISGVAFRTVPGPGPSIAPEQVAAAAAPGGLPRVSLLVWENTHNVSGGTVLDRAVMEAGSAAAREHGLRVHLDGARLFNAAVAAAVPAAALAAPADTVMFCFSKGLGAPIGSVLCGEAGLVAAAREVRGRLGGAMRQVGVIAAAARVALAGRERLAEDHLVARRLHEGLAGVLPEAVGPPPDTNMVLVDGAGVPGGVDRLRARLEDAGVLVGFIRPGILRFVTHRDVDGGDADRVVRVARPAG